MSIVRAAIKPWQFRAEFPKLRRDFPAKTFELPHIDKAAPTPAVATLHVTEANCGRTLSEHFFVWITAEQLAMLTQRQDEPHNAHTMNPRIEEVSESDSDPSEMDIDDMNELLAARRADEIISARNIPATTQDRQEMLQPQGPNVKTSTDREKSKHYQCLYPVYFDKSRTRAEGRRIGSEFAVENPLAREMADAAASLRLSTVFEPDKTHPKDWANPGRVRVLLKKDGKLTDPDINNKHHLYILIAQYLKQHPTQTNTPFRLPIAGMPMPKEMPEPAVPKGWKLNKILPLHSPALTGGGVSENFLQDMMAEMGGQLPGGLESGASSGAEGKQKKPKKKIIRA